MAYIKREAKNYLLVAYRPLANGPEVFWRCPDREAFDRFVRFEAGHKDSKAPGPVPPPEKIFGEVKRPKKASPGHEPRASSGSLPEGSKPSRKTFTLSEWVGTFDDPGPYFTHSRAMGTAHRKTYFSCVKNRAELIRDLPMHEVTSADAALVRDWMLVCPDCRGRAESQGRSDVLAKAPATLLATAPPWDGRGMCIGEDGANSHYTLLQKATITNNLTILKTLWNVAIREGSGVHPAQPRCAEIASNPFTHCPIPRFKDRPDNDDLVQALSHEQVERFARSMPPEFQTSITISVHGMLRREEVLGLSRQMCTWPEEEKDDQAILRVTEVLNPVDGLRGFAKTTMSATEPIYLTAFATERLIEHLDVYRSNPNPDACEACAAGIGAVMDNSPNLHRGCDFAGDAALFVVADTGQRPTPDAYSSMVEVAAVAAGLTPAEIGFRPSHKTLRATGATMLLELGAPPELVQRMGRWTNIETLRRHYFRVRDTAKVKATGSLDAQVRGELGLDPVEMADPGDRIHYLEGRVVHLEAELATLRAAFDESGLDPAELVWKPAVPIRKKRSGGAWGQWDRSTVDWDRSSALDDHDRLRDAVAAGGSRSDVLKHMGLSAATKNYRRLESVADELGLELPPKWHRQAS
jgi:integrase